MSGFCRFPAVLLTAICLSQMSAAFVFAPSGSFGIAQQRGQREVTTTAQKRHMVVSSLVQEAPQIYNYCLHDFPLVTQMTTAGVFSTIGDILAQAKAKWDDPSKEYNPTRTQHYFLKGLGGGIMWSEWYGMSDIWSTAVTDALSLPNTAATHTISSILLEQFLVCPIFYALWDIPVVAWLAGSPLRTMPLQVESKLPDMLVANAKVWTPVNVVTYNLPVEYRVLFTSVADILWQSVNSAITTREIVVPATEKTGAVSLERRPSVVPMRRAATVETGP